MSSKKKKAPVKKQPVSPAVIIAILVAILAAAGVIVGCIFLFRNSSAPSSPVSPAPESSSESSVPAQVSYEETSYDVKDGNRYVQIEMEDGGKIVLELYPDIAPVTVENFVGLASKGFYDGLIFHRVISGFVIQGGDPEGTGFGGSDTRIKGEFSANGFENNLSHERGVISMAREGRDMDSASSQFFIVHRDRPDLDGQYAAFGRVVSGMDVVDHIASVLTDSNDKPLTNQVMKKVTVLK